jgi:hypothetical protein
MESQAKVSILMAIDAMQSKVDHMQDIYSKREVLEIVDLFRKVVNDVGGWDVQERKPIDLSIVKKETMDEVKKIIKDYDLSDDFDISLDIDCRVRVEVNTGGLIADVVDAIEDQFDDLQNSINSNL